MGCNHSTASSRRGLWAVLCVESVEPQRLEQWHLWSVAAAVCNSTVGSITLVSSVSYVISWSVAQHCFLRLPLWQTSAMSMSPVWNEMQGICTHTPSHTHKLLTPQSFLWPNTPWSDHMTIRWPLAHSMSIAPTYILAHGHSSFNTYCIIYTVIHDSRNAVTACIAVYCRQYNAGIYILISDHMCGLFLPLPHTHNYTITCVHVRIIYTPLALGGVTGQLWKSCIQCVPIL